MQQVSGCAVGRVWGVRDHLRFKVQGEGRVGDIDICIQEANAV